MTVDAAVAPGPDNNERNRTMAKLFYVCLDSASEVVCFWVVDGDQVPAAAIAIERSALGRQRLWRLAQVIERDPDVYGTYPYDQSQGTIDDHGRRPPLDSYRSDELEHHIIVIEQGSARPGPLLVALTQQQLDEPAPDVFVTRAPVDVLTCARWVEGARVIAALPGMDADVPWFERDGENFRNYTVSRGAPIQEFPPEWQAALRVGVAAPIAQIEVFTLSRVCRETKLARSADPAVLRECAYGRSSRSPEPVLYSRTRHAPPLRRLHRSRRQADAVPGR